MKKYIKKAAHIVAVQWNGNNQDEIKEFLGGGYVIGQERTPGGALIIHNGKGQQEMKVYLGEILYREVKPGELEGRIDSLAPHELEQYEAYTPEAAILKAQYAVEDAGADKLLTDAAVHLEKAKELVKEFADKK